MRNGALESGSVAPTHDGDTNEPDRESGDIIELVKRVTSANERLYDLTRQVESLTGRLVGVETATGFDDTFKDNRAGQIGQALAAVDLLHVRLSQLESHLEPLHRL